MSFKPIAVALCLGGLLIFSSATISKATIVSFNVDFFRDNGAAIGGGTLTGMISFDDTDPGGLVALTDAMFVFDAISGSFFDTVWTLDEADFEDVFLSGGLPFEFIGNTYTDTETGRELILTAGNGGVGGDWQITGIGTPDTDGIYSFSEKTEVSEPAFLTLFGAGLFGLAVSRKRRTRIR